jgi:hypothetical protein
LLNQRDRPRDHVECPGQQVSLHDTASD